MFRCCSLETSHPLEGDVLMLWKTEERTERGPMGSGNQEMLIEHSLGDNHPWNSPGQNTGAGSLSHLQGTFPTQGLNPGLPHCRRILYQLSHQGSPRILERVAYPFPSGSSRPRNQTRVFCVAGGFFTN